MTSVKLKMQPHELNSLIGFLEHTFPSNYSSDHEFKLLQAVLTELLIKLRKAEVEYKKEYRVTISVAMGMALIIQAKKRLGLIPSPDQITVNKLIGIIDQKTV